MRADIFLVTHGHAKSRSEAKSFIESGAVSINGKKVTKPAENIDGDAATPVDIKKTMPYVSRGGLKLEAALDAFSIDVVGMRAIDIGASTGGFTDCLLQKGAASVVALDAGHGQLDPRLLSDPRIKNIEGFNARLLCEPSRGGIDDVFDIAVMDVSFISQTYIIPGIPGLLQPGGIFVSLIKPQFEAGRDAVGKGGIVKNPKHRAAAVKRVTDCAQSNGFSLIGVIPSPIEGGDGNIEYLAAFRL